MTTPTLTLRRIDAFTDDEIDGLSRVLIDCVEGGASVSFMLPITRETAASFWRRSAASARRGEREILVAEDETGIIGTVTVILDAPENQPHRGEIAKMLVHRRARRRGIAAALLTAAEEAARDAGKFLLVLDTVTGGDAERLYGRCGWERCGVIPDYALFPDGRFCSTTFFYKKIAP